MKSNKYKYQICEFPNVYQGNNSCSIDPSSSKLIFRPNTQSYDKNFNLSSINFKKDFNKNTKSSIVYGNFGLNKLNDSKNFNIDQSKFNSESKLINVKSNTLFTKIKKIEGLGLCKLTVYIENKKYFYLNVDLLFVQQITLNVNILYILKKLMVIFC